MTEKSWQFAKFALRNCTTWSGWRNTLSAVCLLGVAGPVAASQFTVFAARCLDPFEHFSPPILGELEPVETGPGYSAYGLPEGYVLIYETQRWDAVAACTVLGRPEAGAVRRFELWVAGQIAEGRYDEVSEGRWLSTTWAEPRVAVELEVSTDAVSMRVMETDLES